jgi:hypothetical protein
MRKSPKIEADQAWQRVFFNTIAYGLLLAVRPIPTSHGLGVSPTWVNLRKLYLAVHQGTTTQYCCVSEAFESLMKYFEKMNWLSS